MLSHLKSYNIHVILQKTFATSLSTEHVQNLFTQYSDFIKDFLSKQQSSSVSLNLRNDLLWFKESLYSSLAKSSFRKLNQVVASLLLAIEIAQLVPEFYPVSVEYFIGEICRETSASFESDISFDSILTSINDNKENLGQLSIIKVFPVVTPGRYSLFSFLGDVLKNNLTVEEFINCVGIPLNERTTLSNFSIWLFKELQVQKLIKSK